MLLDTMVNDGYLGCLWLDMVRCVWLRLAIVGYGCLPLAIVDDCWLLLLLNSDNQAVLTMAEAVVGFITPC